MVNAGNVINSRAHISPMDQRDNPRMVSHGGVLSLSLFSFQGQQMCEEPDYDGHRKARSQKKTFYSPSFDVGLRCGGEKKKMGPT